MASLRRWVLYLLFGEDSSLFSRLRRIDEIDDLRARVDALTAVEDKVTAVEEKIEKQLIAPRRSISWVGWRRNKESSLAKGRQRVGHGVGSENKTTSIGNGG